MAERSLTEILGDNVARYRDKAGLTQAELAELAGVSTAFISRVERGEKSMKLATLCAVAKALRVSCDALLTEESAQAALINIDRLLAEMPDEYVAGIERLIRVCVEEFDTKRERPQ